MTQPATRQEPMSDLREQRHASITLGLLLDELPHTASVRELDWRSFVQVARGNGVLIRLADRLAAFGEVIPDFVADAVTGEKHRSQEALRLLRQLSRNCRSGGLAYAFTKALQHYPDRCDDLEVLLLTPRLAVDRHVFQGLPAVPKPRSLDQRIARITSYRLAGRETDVSILHGRLGALGEDQRFPRALVGNLRLLTIAGMSYRVPAPEDQLILQAMQRVWGRGSLRLADVLHAISVIRGEPIDWASLARRARTAYALHSLSCFLTYVDQIHEEVFDRAVLPDLARDVLKLGRRWGRVEFRSGRYRFPLARVQRSAYAARLLGALGSGNWDGAGRLGLFPLLAPTGRLPAARAS